MAKVTFIGDPNDDFSGADKITVGGKTYEKNKAVTVDDAVAKRLSTHSHFKVSGLKDKVEDEAVEDAGQEAVIGSTTGDPETMDRNAMIAGEDDDASTPMGEPV